MIFLKPKIKKDISTSTIQAFCNDSDDAFGEIFNTFSDRVFNFSCDFMKNRSDAEEVTQEVFVKLWESRKSVNPEENLNAYIFTITRNLIFNRHKKKLNEWKYLDHLRNHLNHTNRDTQEAVLLNELQGIIQKCIEEMPERRRQVFELSRIKCLSHKEISKELNISTKTIEIHISMALKDLRKVLKDYYLIVILLGIS